MPETKEYPRTHRIVMFRCARPADDNRPMAEFVAELRAALAPVCNTATPMGEEYIVDGERVTVEEWEQAIDAVAPEPAPASPAPLPAPPPPKVEL